MRIRFWVGSSVTVTFDKVFLCFHLHYGLSDAFLFGSGRTTVFIPHCIGSHHCCSSYLLLVALVIYCSITNHPKLRCFIPPPSSCLGACASRIGRDLEEMVHLCSHRVSGWLSSHPRGLSPSPWRLLIRGSSLSFQHGGWFQRGWSPEASWGPGSSAASHHFGLIVLV